MGLTQDYVGDSTEKTLKWKTVSAPKSKASALWLRNLK